MLRRPPKKMPPSSTAVKDKVVRMFGQRSMRTLLDALSHTPVGVVEHVGSVLALCACVVEAGLTASRALTFPSPTVGGVATANGSLAITDEGRKRAAAIVDHARQLRRLHLRANNTEKNIPRSRANKHQMLGPRRAGTIGVKGEEAMMALGDLGKWAIVHKRNLPCLMKILQAAEALLLSDALLVRHFARMIGAQEAREALVEAGIFLGHVTQTCDALVEEVRRRAIAAVSVQRFWRGARVQRHQQAADPGHLGDDSLEEAKVPTAGGTVAFLPASRTNRHVGSDDIHQLAAAEMVRAVDSALFLAGTRTKAAVVLQRWTRIRRSRQYREEARVRMRTERLVTAAVGVQALARGISARRHASRATRRAAAAVTVQAFWRGLLGWKRARSREFGVVFLQRWWRYTTALSHLSRISALAQTRNLESLADSASYVRRITLGIFSHDEPTLGLSASRYPRKVWIHKQWTRQMITPLSPSSVGRLGRSQRDSRLGIADCDHRDASLSLHLAKARFEMEQRSTPKAAGDILRALVTRHFSQPPALGKLTSALRRRKNRVGGDGSLSLTHRTGEMAAVRAGQGQHAPGLTPRFIEGKENHNNNTNTKSSSNNNDSNSNNNGPACAIDGSDGMPVSPGKGPEPRTAVSGAFRGEPLQDIDGAKFPSEIPSRTVQPTLGLASTDRCEVAAGPSAPDGGKSASPCLSIVDEVASQQADAHRKTSRGLGMEYDAPLARPSCQTGNGTDLAARATSTAPLQRAEKATNVPQTPSSPTDAPSAGMRLLHRHRQRHRGDSDEQTAATAAGAPLLPGGCRAAVPHGQCLPPETCRPPPARPSHQFWTAPSRTRPEG
ncbi:hypothetical protein Esi_0009_0067 [Ectocarpus siliculosus]|uniref:Uncharacterized protein n=1 Tax=Ectocarpus siliculosus TaxID=2880 RepID=D8LTN5_ECTSI|nr:hypothetical protein Esi_0009_0067 [Ectocarpus siliculosus]|eukprot:CBN73932.1 hypothetical protein Esi_0009_0067 [Ectocarpus siliculosus]